MEPTAASEDEKVVDHVRERYGRIAKEGGSCCAPSCCSPAQPALSSELGYRREDLESMPEEADLGLGCGAPVGRLRLEPGETVLDLGSGPGLDAFLAARAVGGQGHVIGVDMTTAMIERARRGAAQLGLAQVEFREGRLEALPVDDHSVDAVTSNCVINLVPDKGRVFREVTRVLKPGGRLVVSDIVLDAPLPQAVEKDVYAYVGCVAGAMLRDRYFDLVREAGLADVEVLSDVDYLDGLRRAAPAEAAALLGRTGVRWEDVAGRVRSVTYRARKPAV